MPHCRDCADHNGICPGSGKPCNPADVLVAMRRASPPYDTWPELGHLPFDMHGEQFAVTRVPCALDDPRKWRVSHVSTGVAIPSSAHETKEGAKTKGIDALTNAGPEKFKAAIARVKATIAEGLLPA